jgi:hypothetical protein
VATKTEPTIEIKPNRAERRQAVKATLVHGIDPRKVWPTAPLVWPYPNIPTTFRMSTGNRATMFAVLASGLLPSPLNGEVYRDLVGAVNVLRGYTPGMNGAARSGVGVPWLFSKDARDCTPGLAIGELAGGKVGLVKADSKAAYHRKSAAAAQAGFSPATPATMPELRKAVEGAKNKATGKGKAKHKASSASNGKVKLLTAAAAGLGMAEGKPIDAVPAILSADDVLALATNVPE